MTQKAKQQKFIIDWMRPGEKGLGGHTCGLGLRVRTGGRVTMAGRSIEGLIVRRHWEGESSCKGCIATAQEISEEETWKDEQGKRAVTHKDKEHIASKLMWVEDTRKNKTLLVWLLVLTVKSIVVLLRSRRLTEDIMNKKSKPQGIEVSKYQQPEEIQLHKTWVKSGVG